MEKEKRGFACMSESRRKHIASLGGLSSNKNGRAHRFNSETARIAGRKGGIARAKKYGKK